MAFDFDLNSALAGAKTAYELAAAPEEAAMKRRLQEEQIAASKQQRATQEFALEEQKKQAGDRDALRNINTQLAGIEAMKQQATKIAADRTQPVDIRRQNAFNLLQKGQIAVLKNNPGTFGSDVVDEGNKLATEYGQLVSAMQNNNGQITWDTKDKVADMVNRAAKYTGQYQTEYDKDTFRGQLMQDGSVNVYAKDKEGRDVLVDTYKNPHELATMIHSDNRALDAVSDALKVSAAKYGDTTWKDIEAKNLHLTEVEKLENVMPTQALKQQAAILKSLNKEAYNAALPKLIEASNAYFSTKAGIEAKALISPYIKDVLKGMSKYKSGSEKLDYLNNVDLDLIVPPEVQQKIAGLGGDVKGILTTELFGNKSLVERVGAAGKLKTDETEANAKLRIANQKNTSSKDFKGDMDAYNKAIDRARKALSSDVNYMFLSPEAQRAAVMNQPDVISATNVIKTTWGIDPETQKSITGQRALPTRGSLDRPDDDSALPPANPKVEAPKTEKAIPKASPSQLALSELENRPDIVAAKEKHRQQLIDKKKRDQEEETRMQARRIAARVSEYEKIKNDPYAVVPVNNPKTGQPINGGMAKMNLKDTFFSKETGLYYPK